MGILKITKNEKTTIVGEAPKTTITSEESKLLGNLNNIGDGYDFDFGHDKDDNRLKTENGIINVCVSTFLSVASAIGVIVLIYYVFTKYIGIDFELFTKSATYTVEHFNYELRRTFIILGIFLLASSLMLMLFVNSSVTGRFRKKYLSKVNIYIYDVFIIMFIGVIYILLGVAYFYMLDNLSLVFNNLIKDGMINGKVNIVIVEIFRYIVVVCVSIFIVLNSYLAIGIVHKKNKFVFDEAI